MKPFFGCITHVPPWTTFDRGIHVIGLGSYQPSDCLALGRVAPDWNWAHPFLGGTAGAFVIKRAVSWGCYSHVCIFQYRKFLSPNGIGRQSDSYPAMNVASLESIGHHISTSLLGGDNAYLLSGEAAALISHPGYLQNSISYFRQYDGFHYGEDLLDFTRAAIEADALSPNEAVRFLSETDFFPAGAEIGVVPVDFWVPMIEKVEKTVELCLHRRVVRREQYQARYLSFCSERLTSYLLIKYLMESRAQVCYGKIVTLVNAENEDYLVGT